MTLPHIPIVRRGNVYESMDKTEVANLRSGDPLVSISQANAGIIRRDMKRIGESFDALNEFSCAQLLDISRKAGELFMHESLPLGENGNTQSPDDYVEALSSTSGLPFRLCQLNMDKIHEVFTEMPTIIKGLTRGLDLNVIDKGLGEQEGVLLSYYPQAKSMGIVLPSNSPGVNSIWMPAIGLKIPVVIKPGREEPWTPYRIIQAFIAAGCPAEAFSFYPTTHEGANTILTSCERGIIFGDEKTIANYANNSAIQVHGPGWSKILVGNDQVERWQELIELMVQSVAANGGRSCINVSSIVTPKYGDEIADTLAKSLAKLKPVKADNPEAQLSGFANPDFAEYINQAIEADINTPGAEDITARYRNGDRKVEFEGIHYLLPTVVRCQSFEHPLANREFLFPYTSVVEVPQEEMLNQMGPSLVVSAITGHEDFIKQLVHSPLIQRLNIGDHPTTRVRWDQPHEGNLFEFLYKRRAIQF